ncbi:hypothetical protein [Wolbachia endosymbiont (group A) of Pogonocherus hispidulus]|uniref:hypothetical protein n=1 Tax=Wolbachia endosymbiont (group A) of Pogonocherus hispidulus TaxID=3066136 RepID=UPI00333FD79F
MQQSPLESSFPYNLIKNVYFLATFILINSVCLLTIKILGSQWALLHRSSEKNWQLLTKFIINSHLTVEEKICHKK